VGALCTAGTVVRSRPAKSPRAAPATSQCLAPSLSLLHPIGESAHDAASTRIHVLHPSGLPQPVTTGWNSGPWAFPWASHPAVTHDARQGGDGPAHWTEPYIFDINVTSNLLRCVLLYSCDLVSHDLV
jgi:hypothetical protein